MLSTTMVAGYYDTNEMYTRGPCMEYYGPDGSYGIQDSGAPVPCVYHAATGGVRMLPQLPGGHLVQQVVDENGTLLHVLLSPVPMPPIPYAPGASPGQQAAASGYFPSYPTYPTPPCPQFLPVPCNGTPIPPLISSHKGSPSPDDRRQYLRHKKKLESRQHHQQNGWVMLSPSSSCSSASSQSSTPQPGEGCRKRHRNGGPPPDPTRGEDLEKGVIHADEAEAKFIIKILSSIQAPTVSEVSTTSALVQWLYPDLGTNLPLLYEVLLADSDCSEGHYKIAYSGSQSEYRLQHLTPNTTYHVSVQAFCSDLRGSPSPEVTFSTLPLPSKPPRPLPPKLLSRTKNSLTLRWTGPSSRGGSKICAFILEWDQGAEGFSELYRGQQRQFKVAKLQPGASYHFRLALVTDLGESDWSEVAQFHTGPSTSVPATTTAIPPPSLAQAHRDSLQLEWTPAGSVLQMETSPGSWRQIYSGTSSQFLCSHLLPDTSYTFRLEGEGEVQSRAVSYSTLPEEEEHQLPAPTVVGVCGDALELEWPESPSLEDLRLEVDSGEGFEVVDIGSSRKLTNLQPGTRYQLRLVSRDLVSEVTSISTPGPPRLLRIPTSSTSSSSSLPISLSWEPHQPDVSQYEVEMRSAQQPGWQQVYHGEAARCDISHYPAGCELAFRARALSPLGPWSDSLLVETGPPAPTACRAVPTSPHTAALSWQPSSEASCFRLEWSHHPSDSFLQAYQGPNPCYNMCGLRPASQYHFRVQALSRSGLGGPYSPSFSCQTPAGPPGLVSAASLNCKATSHSLALSWNPPEESGGSPVLGYAVEVRPGELEHSTESPSVMLDNLTPRTAYSVAIRAFNSAGSGEPCTPVTLGTLDLPPEPPALLECSTASHGSLRLRWTPPLRCTTELSYTLEMGIRPGSFSPVYQGPATRHKVSRLQENCPYHFRVCSTHPILGAGPYSPVATFSTTFAPPPPLKAPRVTEVTDCGCQVDWTPVRSTDPLSYQVQLQARSSETYITVYQGKSHSHLLEGLEPGKVYVVRVAAVRHLLNGNTLCGPFSTATAFTTQPAPRIQAPEKTQSATILKSYSLTDKHYAFLILVAFTSFSCLLATLLHGLLEHKPA